MKAIQTKYLGPTDRKGSRIKAFDLDNNQVTISYNHALNADGNHEAAANTLAAKMGWKGKMVEGAIKSGHVFVFVN